MSVKNSLNQASQKRSHALAVASSDCSLQHQRNIVLEQLCQSLEGQGGLKRCIQDALAFDLGSCSRTTAKVGSSAHSISEVGRHEACGEKTDGRNGLVCDSCEEMYHISCIEPAVKEIPVRSWYCAKCTGKGTECPHENCIACERLNASRSRLDGNGEDELASEEAPEELEESSNELVANGGDKRFTHCKPPRTAIPRGKWFCTKCDAGIQRVRKAKLLYENIQNKSRKRSLDGKLKTEEALNKSGGVDMLLNAAKTLNYEENLAAMRLKAT
ncbi:UNVERIFIED_CONTAM: hypothetical protein Sradi_5181200 [Sesamum radiatum]|uniref:Zinc finger PHD-type domain-containing protein n=1 Tax=Sesamum radiatum TaxID=300843 RepID=A0AAW2M3K2_SESRA